MRRERQDLVQKFVELQRYVVILAASKRKKRRRARAADNDSDDEDEEYAGMVPANLLDRAIAIRTGAQKAAHTYVVFWNCSTPRSLTGSPKPSFEWDDVDKRFESEETARRALTAELYQCTPSKFHEFIRFDRDPFCSLVCPIPRCPMYKPSKHYRLVL